MSWNGRVSWNYRMIITPIIIILKDEPRLGKEGILLAMAINTEGEENEELCSAASVLPSRF